MTALAFNNPRVQELRRLIGRRSSRHDEGRFVVEGQVLVAEAVARRMDASIEQFVPEGSGADVDGAGEVFELAAGVFERVALHRRPRNHRSPSCEMRDHERRARWLDRRRSSSCSTGSAIPGNLGTIIRSAEAAGVDVVVLTAGSVDPYSPKVVRSSAGAIFHVPVVVGDDSTTWPQQGCSLVGTSSHDAAGTDRRAHTATPTSPGAIALVMGNEAAGLPDDWNDSRRPDRSLDHDPAPRTQRVAECGDGRDGARCSRPPGNAIRRARTAGTVGHQQECVRVDPQAPAPDTDHVVEQTLRVPPGEQDREPGHDHGEERTDHQEEQHDEVGDGEEPLDEREEPVEVAFDVVRDSRCRGGRAVARPSTGTRR